MAGGWCVILLGERGRNRLGIFLVLLNSILALAGLALVVAGAYVKTHLENSLVLVEGYRPGPLPNLLMCIGGLITIFGIVGSILCFACAFWSTRQRWEIGFQYSLDIYLLLIFLFTWVILAGGCITARHKNKLSKALDSGLLKSMASYPDVMVVKEALDETQMTSQCCGSSGYTDWFNIPWMGIRYFNTTHPKVKSMLKDGKILADSVPFSCCDPTATRSCIHHHVTSTSHHHNYDPASNVTLFTMGCAQALTNRIHNTVLGPIARYIFWLLLAQWVIILVVRYLQTSVYNAYVRGTPDGIAPGFLCRSLLCSIEADLDSCESEKNDEGDPKPDKDDDCEPLLQNIGDDIYPSADIMLKPTPTLSISEIPGWPGKAGELSIHVMGQPKEPPLPHYMPESSELPVINQPRAPPLPPHMSGFQEMSDTSPAGLHPTPSPMPGFQEFSGTGLPPSMSESPGIPGGGIPGAPPLPPNMSGPPGLLVTAQTEIPPLPPEMSVSPAAPGVPPLPPHMSASPGLPGTAEPGGTPLPPNMSGSPGMPVSGHPGVPNITPDMYGSPGFPDAGHPGVQPLQQGMPASPGFPNPMYPGESHPGGPPVPPYLYGSSQNPYMHTVQTAQMQTGPPRFQSMTNKETNLLGIAGLEFPTSLSGAASLVHQVVGQSPGQILDNMLNVRGTERPCQPSYHSRIPSYSSSGPPSRCDEYANDMGESKLDRFADGLARLGEMTGQPNGGDGGGGSDDEGDGGGEDARGQNGEEERGKDKNSGREKKDEKNKKDKEKKDKKDKEKKEKDKKKKDQKEKDKKNRDKKDKGTNDKKKKEKGKSDNKGKKDKGKSGNKDNKDKGKSDKKDKGKADKKEKKAEQHGKGADKKQDASTSRKDGQNKSTKSSDKKGKSDTAGKNKQQKSNDKNQPKKKGPETKSPGKSPKSKNNTASAKKKPAKKKTTSTAAKKKSTKSGRSTKKQKKPMKRPKKKMKKSMKKPKRSGKSGKSKASKRGRRK